MELIVLSNCHVICTVLTVRESFGREAASLAYRDNVVLMIRGVVDSRAGRALANSGP